MNFIVTTIVGNHCCVSNCNKSSAGNNIKLSYSAERTKNAFHKKITYYRIESTSEMLAIFSQIAASSFIFCYNYIVNE
jgi:hypothetical protein